MTSMDQIRFDGNGLVPAIVQDARTGQVRMLGYMNRDALSKTIETGRLHFFSRSRQSLWMKGETSGNLHHVHEVRYDCDGDTLLVQVTPDGPTCHTGDDTCFDRAPVSSTVAGTSAYRDIVRDLADVIADRNRERPEGSYTTYLFTEGVDKIGKKIGEEAAEVIIAAKNTDDEALAREAADLIYHLLVMLEARELSLDAVLAELARRRAGPRAAQPSST
jgi:phosphoribosyl-AMP cyclohydrolase / phosphoribosyl-ATP pyrophosphohydrolase